MGRSWWSWGHWASKVSWVLCAGGRGLCTLSGISLPTPISGMETGKVKIGQSRLSLLRFYCFSRINVPLVDFQNFENLDFVHHVSILILSWRGGLLNVLTPLFCWCHLGSYNEAIKSMTAALFFILLTVMCCPTRGYNRPSDSLCWKVADGFVCEKVKEKS